MYKGKSYNVYLGKSETNYCIYKVIIGIYEKRIIIKE